MNHLLIITLTFFLSPLTFSQALEWTAYGQEPGGKRFVASEQINKQNVKQLTVAWQFQTGELELYKDSRYLLNKAAFEATPLMIGASCISLRLPINSLLSMPRVERKSGNLIPI